MQLELVIPQEHICYCPSPYLLLGHLYTKQSEPTREELLQLVCAALLQSQRDPHELRVFWLCPIPAGVAEHGLVELLYCHLVDFARKIDFAPRDFFNAHVLFP
ncbi:MAG: hypothetical protein D6820_07480, partial [Lentisphaerae bacterium]